MPEETMELTVVQRITAIPLYQLSRKSLRQAGLRDSVVLRTLLDSTLDPPLPEEYIQLLLGQVFTAAEANHARMEQLFDRLGLQLFHLEGAIYELIDTMKPRERPASTHKPRPRDERTLRERTRAD